MAVPGSSPVVGADSPPFGVLPSPSPGACVAVPGSERVDGVELGEDGTMTAGAGEEDEVDGSLVLAARGKGEAPPAAR